MASGQQRPHGLTLPGQGQAQQSTQHTQSQPPHFKQEPRPSTLGLAQTDGAEDEPSKEPASCVASRHAFPDEEPMCRAAVDGMIRRYVEENAQSLEAGGLLVPLDERRPSKGHKNKPRTGAKPHSSKPDQESSSPATTSSNATVQRGRFDGADSGSEEDETAGADAINSDLDDSDEDVVNGGIEGHTGNDVILCLYDKVQRTKNKWKCTLKDGVVTVEGKDYVFHKANGEFEW